MNAAAQISETVSVEEQTSETTQTEQPDPGGRFARGNSGGPGNPFGRQVAVLRKVLLECVTEEEMSAIGSKLVDMAKSGNLQAIKLLFSYTLGKPGETVNPDRVDMDEWELYRLLAAIPKEADEVALVPDQSMTLKLARVMRPAMAEIMSNGLRNDIEADRAAAQEKEMKRQQQKILREQRRAEKQKQEKKSKGTAGQAAASRANGPAAPSTNGKTEEEEVIHMSVNGETDEEKVVCPSTNGNSEGDADVYPSTNGLEEEILAGSESNLTDNQKESLRNRFGSLMHLLSGRKISPED